MWLDESKFEQIAKIQKSELEYRDSVFLSECSIKFISLFYKKVIHYNSTIFCVDETQQNEIKGFVFCTTNGQGYFRNFFNETKLQLICYPSIYISLFKALLRRVGSKLLDYKHKTYNYNCEIVYMAVKRQYQEQGVGKKLINLAEREFVKRGINKYFLEVFSGNNRAIKFYKTSGFVIVQSFKRGNMKKLIMYKDLPRFDIKNPLKQ